MGLQTHGSPGPWRAERFPWGGARFKWARGNPRRVGFLGRSLVAALLLAGAPGCTTPTASTEREPANLWHLKQELKAYIDSGAYERSIAAVAAEAKAWVEHRAGPPASSEVERPASSEVERPASSGVERPASNGAEGLAIVFDLDETLLSNLPHMRARDFGYEPAVWNAWVEKAAAPAIPSVAEIYHAARARGVTVFYITGRSQRGRAATEANLRQLGLADHAALFCKPADSRESSQAFKTAIRKRLTEEGYTIIANIGDQESDLAGGYAERTFKLPNPFYITR